MDYQHIPLFLGLTILMSACSNELTEEPAPSEGQPVNFKISTVLNRSVTNPDNSTEFIAGDRIGIYGVKGATGSNVAFIVGNDGQPQAEAGSGIFYNVAGGTTADFHAYYPYTPGQNGQTVSFAVGADQSTPELFNASDFMTASTLGIPTGSESPVTLIFQHRLAVVQLEVVTSQAGALKGAAVCNVAGTAIWDMIANTVSASGENTTVKMWGRSDDGLSYWAAVPAQTVAQGTRLLTLDFGDESYAFTTTAPVTLSEGLIKKFRIGIGDQNDVVVFSSDLEVKPWQEDPDHVEGSGELVEPDPLMPLQDFSDFNPIAISKNKEEITAPGWYLFHLYHRRRRPRQSDAHQTCNSGWQNQSRMA